MMKFKSLFLMFFFVLGSFTIAEAGTYTIDKDHSSITFKVRHLVGKVVGTFDDFAGTIEFDEANQEASHIQATIQAASINTRNKKRDDHLKTADFFDTATFQDARFVSKSIDMDTGVILGDLTLHGVTKEIELSYVYNGTAQDHRGQTHIGGTAEAILDRRDFNINYDPTGVTIGHAVTLTLEIEAILQT